MSKQTVFPDNWLVFEDTQSVAIEVAKQMIDVANGAISEKGRFDLVTAGGTTPNMIYRMLTEFEKTQTQITDWSKWYIYVGDERVLPAGDAERNSQMLEQHWLAESQIPVENRIYMPTELGLEVAADFYRTAIASVSFDLVLLGMGEDGHTASLFPDHSSVSLGGVVCEKQSPKPPAERLSLSYERLNSAQWVFKIITGRSKTPALQAWLEGVDLPITRVQGVKVTSVFMDQSAVSDLR